MQPLNDSSSLAHSPPRKPVIGLAGGIGSGKSLVARQLGQLGCAVINADELSHEVLRQSEVREMLVQWWGREVLDEKGQVDRAAVGRRVFDNPEALARLEALVHPRVHVLRQALHVQAMANAADLAIVEDCPLLYEVGLDKQCDVVIFVDARREVRVKRVAQYRGWTDSQLLARENNQLGLDIKAKQADYIVDNSEEEARTFEQVRPILLKIIQDYKQQPEKIPQ